MENYHTVFPTIIIDTFCVIFNAYNYIIINAQYCNGIVCDLYSLIKMRLNQFSMEYYSRFQVPEVYYNTHYTEADFDQ